MRADEFTPDAPGSLTEITVTILDPASSAFVDQSSPAFVPDALPQQINLDSALVRLLEEATNELARLNARAVASTTSPALARPFIRREAVSSSSIEGTASTYDDLVTFEQLTMFDAGTPARKDEPEVLAYAHALEHGWAQPPDRGVTLGLIRELHSILMKPAGSDLVDPGRFRKSVVFIGGRGLHTARFVPPPPLLVPELMKQFEIQSKLIPGVPRLAWVAMLHYLFETIHPFNDGNGRTGRLLILLHLRQAGFLSLPVLHLSRFIEREKKEYVDLLTSVSQRGDWNNWLEFMLAAFSLEARRSIAVIDRLEELRFRYLAVLQDRRQHLGERIVEYLLADPLFSISAMCRTLDIPYNSGKRAVERLLDAGVVQQTSTGRRNRRFMAPEVIGAHEVDLA